MFLYSLTSVGGALVLGRAVSRSLFLSTLPESAVPYKFILPPLFVIMATLIYSRLVSRFAMYRLIVVSNLVLIAGLLLFRFLLDGPFAPSFPFLLALYSFFEVIGTTVGIQFWSFAGDIFDPREAKRLFGLVAAGGVLSNAIAGVGLRAVSNMFQPKDLIFGVVGGLLLGILCVWILGRQKERDVSSSADSGSTRSLSLGPAADATSTRQDLREIARQPMLIILSSLMIITSLVTNISDFQLDLSLQRYFANDGQGMLAFIGTFQIFVGLVAVLVQIFLTNRILERFGLAAGLLLLPLAVLGGSFMFVLTAGAFWTIALPRGADMTLRFTINDASLNILFLPVRDEFRKRVKAILDGVIKPPVMALLGLFFLFFLRKDIDALGVQASDILPWSYVNLVLLAIWIAVVLQTRKHYESALMERLKSYRLALAQAEFDIKDETTVALITQELQSESSNPLRVIHIIEILKTSEETTWHTHLQPLLYHPSSDVRKLVAQYFEQRALQVRDPYLSNMLLSLFEDQDAGVRSAAIQAYCALRGDECLPEIVPLIGKADLPSRQAALIGLMKYAGISGVLESAVTLKQFFTSAEAKEREVGAAVLGSLQISNYYQPLLVLLNDPQDSVQREAIRAAGELRHPMLIPRLIEKLTIRRHERYARAALVEYGVKVVPYLSAALADASSVQGQIAVVKVLREIQAAPAARTLEQYFHGPNDHLRAAVVQALANLQAKGVPVYIPRVALVESTLVEIKRTYAIHLLLADLGEQSGRILNRALQDHLGYVLDHLFSILSLLYPQLDMHIVHRAVRSGGGQKVTAIELIDSMTDQEIRDVMLPLVEAPLDRLVQIATLRFGLRRGSLEQRLNELCQHDDPVLRAFALQRIGLLGLESLHDTIHQNLEYNHPLVQEASVWAAMFTHPDDREVRSILEKQAHSPFVQVRTYAQSLLKEVGS